MTQRPSIVRTALIGFLTMALAIIGGAAPASAKTSTSVSILVDTSPRQGETVWFRGIVRTGQVPSSGRTVELQYRPAGSSAGWVTLARTTSKTTSDQVGFYSFKYRPTSQYQYRVVAPGGRSHATGISPTRTLRWGSGSRSLEERVHLMNRWKGVAKSDVRSAHVAGIGTIRYQPRSTALVIESPRGGATRTWIVQGDIRRTYTDLGHARGRLGPPLSDAVCGGPEGGCLQRFSNGVIYDNDNTKPSVVYGTPNAMNQAIAAAKSQVGYGAPASNISKYNRWVGTNNAWCSIFLSWVGEASRTGSYLPKAGKFTDFLAAMNRNTPRGSSPRVGAIAIFDTHLYDGVTAPTHAGLVTGVSGSRIHTIEGNTSNPATGSGRGVYNKTRAASQPLYYYYPRW